MNDNKHNTPGRPPMYQEPTKDVYVRLPLSIIDWLGSLGQPMAKTIRDLVENEYLMVGYELANRCRTCGHELQIVRPGRYQCVNDECGRWTHDDREQK